MSDFGFKISLPGYDVKTATPEQCAIHSSYPAFKSKTNQNLPHFATLQLAFTSTITQNLVQNVYTVDHNYGYIPFTLGSIVFISSVSSGSQTIVGIGFAGVGATLAIEAYSTATQFIVSIYDDGIWTDATARLSVSYYIFAENGT